jgi:hypothetical protein
MKPSLANDNTELRELRGDPAEIEIVAGNMRQTLIDVPGAERGAGFYTLVVPLTREFAEQSG